MLTCQILEMIRDISHSNYQIPHLDFQSLVVIPLWKCLWSNFKFSKLLSHNNVLKPKVSSETESNNLIINPCEIKYQNKYFWHIANSLFFFFFALVEAIYKRKSLLWLMFPLGVTSIKAGRIGIRVSRKSQQKSESSRSQSPAWKTESQWRSLPIQ